MKFLFNLTLIGSILGCSIFNACADAGHSHASSPPPTQSHSSSSTSHDLRVMKTGKTFEIVLKITNPDKPELVIYITDPESNLPINEATATIIYGDGTSLALSKTDKKGVYETPLKKIENKALLISIEKESFKERFTFENLNFSSSNMRFLTVTYMLLALLGLGALVLFLKRKTIKVPGCSAFRFFKTLLIVSVATSNLFSHGGEDHSSKKKKDEQEHTNKEGPQPFIKVEEKITVPKEIQLHLTLTTEKVVERSLKQTTRLTGQVISDPSGYARLQPSQNSRVLNDPDYPLPLPGQKVKKDQIILSLQPLLGKTETSDQKTALYKIESELTKLSKDVERKKKLGQFVTKKDLENAQSDLESAIKQKEEIINKTFKPEYLKSPVDGVVSDLHVRPGEIVTPDKTIVEIVDPSKLMIEALLFDSTLSDEIVKGVARLPLHPNKNIPLELLGVSPKVNKDDQAIHILFKAKANDSSIKLDMAVEVLAELKATKPVLAIPKSAVVEDEKGTWVFVKTSPETFEPRKVRINLYVDHYAEITSGLKVGEIIVTNGSYLLNQER